MATLTNREEEGMEPTNLVIIVPVLAIIFWHKEIDSETTWIYGTYVATIVILYLFAVIDI